MVARLRKCAADTSSNWDGKVTIYPPEARGLVALIDSALDERKGYASVRLEKARQAAERLLGQEQNHSGSGRDGHLSEADLVPLFEALGAVHLDDPNAQLFVSSDEPAVNTRPYAGGGPDA